jgi:hypothetical protein
MRETVSVNQGEANGPSAKKAGAWKAPSVARLETQPTVGVKVEETEVSTAPEKTASSIELSVRTPESVVAASGSPLVPSSTSVSGEPQPASSSAVLEEIGQEEIMDVSFADPLTGNSM